MSTNTDPYQARRPEVGGYYSDLFAQDLHAVGIDLRAVPLDEVLDFSSRYRPQFRAYIRGVYEMARAMRQAGAPREIDEIKQDRLEANEDQRAFLHRASRSEFRRRSLSLLVGVASSAWTIHAGDAVAAALAAASAAVGLAPSAEEPSAYSYLFKIADR